MPELKVFATGGTIDKIYFDASSEYEVGEPQIEVVFREARVSFDYEVTSLMRKDSLEINDDDREQIRAAVEACDHPHILITHGTDGMVATAAALQGIPAKRIVLTGALQPAAFYQTDAIFNVGCAIGAVQSQPPGVYIAMNGQVFPAGKVVKNLEANRFEALP